MNRILNIKRYQIGKVYRRDKPCAARGRFREFYQCDLDIAGSYDRMLPDSECVKIIAEVLEKMDVGDFQIKINHRKLLDGMFEVCGVPAEKIRTVSSSIDKLDKVKWADVKRELVQDKGIEEAVVDKIGSYVQFNGSIELIQKLKQDKTLCRNVDAAQGLEDLEILYNYSSVFGITKRVSCFNCILQYWNFDKILHFFM